jgi:hypothetical protein
MQFGRKSEKMDWQIEQLELKLDELGAHRAENEISSTSVASAPVVHLAREPARRRSSAPCVRFVQESDGHCTV